MIIENVVIYGFLCISWVLITTVHTVNSAWGQGFKSRRVPKPPTNYFIMCLFLRIVADIVSWQNSMGSRRAVGVLNEPSVCAINRKACLQGGTRVTTACPASRQVSHSDDGLNPPPPATLF